MKVFKKLKNIWESSLQNMVKFILDPYPVSGLAILGLAESGTAVSGIAASGFAILGLEISHLVDFWSCLLTVYFRLLNPTPIKA